MKKIFSGQIIKTESGFKIDLDDKAGWAECTKKNYGHRISLIQKREDEREKSLPQLGYYFGYILPTLCPYFELEKDEMHSAVKIQILITEAGVNPKIVYEPSIEDFSTLEMNDFLSRVRAWASRDWGIYLQRPDERGFEFDLIEY